MTIFDLCCDGCGKRLAGLAGSGPATITADRLGVRFTYHPGDPSLGDDSGLLCVPCWDDLADALGTPAVERCARCDVDVSTAALVVARHDERGAPWWLCARHAAEWLNTLRTVDPELDPQEFVLPPRRQPPAPDEPVEQRVELRRRR